MKNAFLDNAWEIFGTSVDLTTDTRNVTATDAFDMVTADLRKMEEGQPARYNIPVDYDALLPLWKSASEKEKTEVLTAVKHIFKDKQHELGDAVAAGDPAAFRAILAPYRDAGEAV